MKKEELLKTVLICACILAGLLIVRSGLEQGESKTVFVSQAWESTLNTLTVQGRWEVFAAPDMAILNLSITQMKPTTKEAQQLANSKTSEVQALLKTFPIKPEDIQTENISIATEYDYGLGSEREIKGYTASYNIQIILRQLDQKKVQELEKLINALTTIEGVGIESLSYDIQDKTQFFSQARALAMKKAKQKADELSTLGKVKLGKPIALAEEINYQPFHQWKMAFSQSNSAVMETASADIGDATIALGQLKISVAINVSYAIQ